MLKIPFFGRYRAGRTLAPTDGLEHRTNAAKQLRPARSIGKTPDTVGDAPQFLHFLTPDFLALNCASSCTFESFGAQALIKAKVSGKD